MLINYRGGEERSCEKTIDRMCALWKNWPHQYLRQLREKDSRDNELLNKRTKYKGESF